MQIIHDVKDRLSTWTVLISRLVTVHDVSECWSTSIPIVAGTSAEITSDRSSIARIQGDASQGIMILTKELYTE